MAKKSVFVKSKGKKDTFQAKLSRDQYLNHYFYFPASLATILTVFKIMAKSKSGPRFLM